MQPAVGLSGAKLAANRANAQLSTGPKSEEGKAVSSQNATTHGLFGKQVAVLEADRAEFEQLRQFFFNRIEPEGVLEDVPFSALVQHAWQLRRLDKLEAALLAESEGKDPLVHPATEKRAMLYMRYRRSFESSYRAAYKELERLQTLRATHIVLGDTKEPLPSLADRFKLMRLRAAVNRDNDRVQRAVERMERLRERIQQEAEMEDAVL